MACKIQQCTSTTSMVLFLMPKLLTYSLVAIGLSGTIAIATPSLVSSPLLWRVEWHAHGIIFVLLHYLLSSKPIDLSEHDVIKETVSGPWNMKVCCWETIRNKSSNQTGSISLKEPNSTTSVVLVSLLHM